jgi:hypothetical protein
VLRRYRNMRVNEAARRAEAGVVDMLKQTAGFRAYYIVDGGGGVGLSVSIFESRKQAQN